MHKFTKLTSGCVPLPVDNIDTDQIMPGRYLVMVTKTGYEETLFHDWRYNADESVNTEFVLNDKRYKGHEILVTGRNFGAGSSREHAVWALTQYGFKVIISPLFADIFKQNAKKNGLLVVELPEAKVTEIQDQIKADPEFQLTVDLESQTVTWSASEILKFEIDAFSKYCILNGLDDIGYMLSKEKETKLYEAKHNK